MPTQFFTAVPWILIIIGYASTMWAANGIILTCSDPNDPMSYFRNILYRFLVLFLIFIVALVSMFFIDTGKSIFYLTVHGVLIFASAVGTWMSLDKFIIAVKYRTPEEEAALAASRAR
jgi:uncharacterized membrane protein